MCRVMQRRPLLDLGQTTTVMRVSALPFGICPSDDLIRSPPAQKATLCCPCNSHFNHLASLYLPLACVAHAMQQRTTPPPAALSLSLSLSLSLLVERVLVVRELPALLVAEVMRRGRPAAPPAAGSLDWTVDTGPCQKRSMSRLVGSLPLTPLHSTPPTTTTTHTATGTTAPAISLLSIPF